MILAYMDDTSSSKFQECNLQDEFDLNKAFPLEPI